MASGTSHDDELVLVEAFGLLWPTREFRYVPRITYSGRFSDYNANIRIRSDVLELRLSHAWKDVSKDIKIGLVQELLLHLLGEKKDSLHIDLYNNFVKSLHHAVPKTKTHPILEESFDRVNEKTFIGLVERPNLVWGTWSKRKLGSYCFKTDTITISKVFVDINDPALLDHVMYHEILHKQVKFDAKGGRARYHTKKFRELEHATFNHEEMERRLLQALRNVRPPRLDQKMGLSGGFFLGKVGSILKMKR